jgi:hypothetical protein
MKAHAGKGRSHKAWWGALAAVCCTTAALAVSPAHAASGSHHLKVKVAWNVRSVAVAIVGSPYTCVALPAPTNGDYARWEDGRVDLPNGVDVRVNKYTSTNCAGNTYWGGTRGTVPGDDGLTSWWLDIS